MASPSDSTGPAIVADHLSREFRVGIRESGIRASFRSLAAREHRIVNAVDDVSFTIERGEVVGFLGPNGAGKTTTLKLASGLLHPTSGTVRVLGHDPARRNHDYLRSIALIMGQRQALMWDLPASDGFDVLRAIYAIPHADFRARVARLTELLALDGLIDKPMRQLSLGERMRCEFAAGLLHAPQVLFLDEPTLGLDVTAQHALRDFIAEYARETGATVLLTSHYMADIEALAERVLVIHHGRLQYDGSLADLTRRMSDCKVVTLTMSTAAQDAALDALAATGDVLERTSETVQIEIPRAEVMQRVSRLAAIDGVTDFTVEDESIENVIQRVFEHSKA